MYHVHINTFIFHSFLMVFNRDMQDMCSCKQNHVLFIASGLDVFMILFSPHGQLGWSGFDLTTLY